MNTVAPNQFFNFESGSYLTESAFNLSQFLKHPTLMDYFLWLLHNLESGQTAQNNFEDGQQFLYFVMNGDFLLSLKTINLYMYIQEDENLPQKRCIL